MITKPKWYSKVFNKLFIYSPVFVLWIQILLIYTIYMTNYILVLINPATNPSLYSSLYIVSHISSYNAGVTLFVIINWCVMMMIISMFRTSFMDPGYMPDPMTLEFKLINKNLEYPYECGQRVNKKTSKRNVKKDNTFTSERSEEFSPIIECDSSGSNLLEVGGTNDFCSPINIYNANENDHNCNSTPPHENTKRYKFIRTFDKFISDGPLTSTEFVKYRTNLEKHLNTHQITNSAIEVQNISVSEKFSLNYTDIFENFRGADFSKLNLCNNCLRWKVERSHHCKQCGKCVLKMDHHCPWLANCIGFRNYKFFCLTIFYGFFATLLIFLTFWEVVIDVNLNYNSSMYYCVLLTFTYITNFGMLCFLTWLFNTNWGLLFSNQTTIEKSEKERFATTGIKAFNYYDMGSYRNFVTVFGKNPLFWLLPLFPNYKGDGIIFES